jgi:hypothetical protein
MLGDHFWPAMYPGLIVGVLVGLAAGGVVATLLGAVGGLGGAMALYFVFSWIGLPDGVVSLIGLLGGAAIGAYLLTTIGKRLTGASRGQHP